MRGIINRKIVVALKETIRLMAEIDKVIEAHGGWPGAFVTLASSTAPCPLLNQEASWVKCSPPQMRRG